MWFDNIAGTAPRKLQAVLLNAKTTNDCPYVIGYEDNTASSRSLAASFGNTNGITTVDILAAPANGASRRINSMSIYNADTVISNVKLIYNDNGTTYVIGVWPLGIGATLILNEASGFDFVIVPSVGRYLRTVVLTGDSDNTGNYSGVYVPGYGCTSARARLVAGGGGGGGATRGTNAPGMGGGGAGGGYAEKLAAVVAYTQYAYTVGAGGAAGSSAGGNGGAGGNTTIFSVTANGGPGGIGMLTGSTLLSALGGASPAVSTGGDLNTGGEPGGYGFRGGSSTGTGGKGGSTCFGEGGNAQTSDAAGNNATVGYGGGGGGACAIASAQVGGKGAPGCIVIDEFSS